MAETQTFNNVFHLRNVSEMNTDDKMQTCTLKNHLMLLRTANVKSFHVSWPIKHPTFHCCYIATTSVLPEQPGSSVVVQQFSPGVDQYRSLLYIKKTSLWQTLVLPLVHSGTKFILMASSNSRLHVLPFSKNYYSSFSLHSKHLQAGNPATSNSWVDTINLPHAHTSVSAEHFWIQVTRTELPDLNHNLWKSTCLLLLH